MKLSLFADRDDAQGIGHIAVHARLVRKRRAGDSERRREGRQEFASHNTLPEVTDLSAEIEAPTSADAQVACIRAQIRADESGRRPVRSGGPDVSGRRERRDRIRWSARLGHPGPRDQENQSRGANVLC